jgi:hypothetical protein
MASKSSTVHKNVSSIAGKESSHDIYCYRYENGGGYLTGVNNISFPISISSFTDCLFFASMISTTTLPHNALHRFLLCCWQVNFDLTVIDSVPSSNWAMYYKSQKISLNRILRASSMALYIKTLFQVTSSNIS